MKYILPPDVLRSIFEFLFDKRLKSVCKQWNSALSIKAIRENFGLEHAHENHYIGDRTKKFTGVFKSRGFPEKLEYLDITSHQFDIAKIQPLHGSLKTLSIRRPADIKSICNFVHVESVKFHCLYNITGVSPIADMPQLKHLYLCDSNNDRVLEPIKRLVNLETLTLKNLVVTNVKPLANLLQLKELRMSHMNVKDIRPLSGLVQLEHLKIYSMYVKSLTPISCLKKLKTLYLYSVTKEADIKWLPHGIVDLTLRYFENVEDIEPIGNLSNLKCLKLYLFPKVKDVSSVLQRCVNLEILKLQYMDCVLNVDGLMVLPHLKTLDIYDVNVSVLPPLQIKKLKISSCKNIINIDWISNMPLERLTLRYLDGLTCIKPIAGMAGLLHLSLSNLPNVKTLEPLMSNQRLKDIEIEKLPHIKKNDFLQRFNTR